jgi:hypothetical protein
MKGVAVVFISQGLEAQLPVADPVSRAAVVTPEMSNAVLLTAAAFIVKSVKVMLSLGPPVPVTLA